MNWFNSTLTPDTFLTEYWQKKPCLFRQAFPDFHPLLEADELAGLACEEDVESRLIIHSDDHHNWELEHGPFSDERFACLPESHWTLLVQAVDHWLPEARDFLKYFQFIPNWRVDDLMISFASLGGGVGPHFDHYDVFLIQAAGTRRWEIGEKYDENSARRTDTPVLILEDWQATAEWELAPGDMLYLPPQFGHNGVATSDHCMTYSVGFRAPSHAEILAGFSDFLIDELKESQRYHDPNLRLQAHPGEISALTIEQVQTILKSLLNDRKKLSHWFGQYASTPKYADSFAFATEALTDPEGNEDTVFNVRKLNTQQTLDITVNPATRILYLDQQDHIDVFVNGRHYVLAHSDRLFIQTLSQEKKAKLTPSNQSKNLLALISTLLRQGALSVI